ncbi:MAG: RsmB/NOP family class I SAM-dependent RNA methyltransferase [Pseudomonadota bacterium]
MTPAARVQAAIDVLDDWLAGTAAEQALTRWARRSRFAGSKDRAAVRDHVFDVLRCHRSCRALGGADTGRGLMLGLLRQTEIDPETLFTGSAYGPAALSSKECQAGHVPDSPAEMLDIPDWLWPEFSASLGEEQAKVTANALRSRAPVFLRVNTARITRTEAQSGLAAQGVRTEPHPEVATALRVLEGARRVAQSDLFLNGLVELQDASSQAVIETLTLELGMRVLDFCAGGGGKSLALAALPGIKVFAHDIAPRRMHDLSHRARRAGADIQILTKADLASVAPFDVVLVDAPCSGSGSWRRAPEGKWSLTIEKLAGLRKVQAEILDEMDKYIAHQGVLAYATCSVLKSENIEQIQNLISRNSSYFFSWDKQWPVNDLGDGFFVSHLTRVN